MDSKGVQKDWRGYNGFKNGSKRVHGNSKRFKRFKEAQKGQSKPNKGLINVKTSQKGLKRLKLVSMDSNVTQKRFKGVQKIQ